MSHRLLLFAVALLGLVMMQTGWNAAFAAATESSAKASKSASAQKPAKRVAQRRAAKSAAKKVKTVRRSVSRPATSAEVLVELDKTGNPLLRSSAFLVANEMTGEVILEKGAGSVLPIASITKLMTAMVVLDAGQSLSEVLTIGTDDMDALKGTGSRLAVGTRLSREEMLHLALMSSENRAASALGRHYPGGMAAFVGAMNIKARLIGLTDTRFHDSTGLNPSNVSSPRDLVRMVSAASTYPLIREFTTSSERFVDVGSRTLRFANTNALVRDPDWHIGVSKTGYIREAGRCLVMKAWLHEQPLIIVLMDSEGRYTRTADAVRIKKWLDAAGFQRVAVTLPPPSGRGI